MAKTSTNVTIDDEIIEVIEELRKSPKENRSFSNMVETLIKEALKNRNIKTKNK